MRRHEHTHPWITFDARKLHNKSELWALLGECQSKCEHIAGVPLRPDVAEELHRIYLAKGAFATTAIEGNTLSEGEVLKVLAGELKLPPSREYLKQEVDNVAAAFNSIYEQIKESALPEMSVDELKKLNRCILNGLSLEPGVVPGEIRSHDVGVSRYRGAPPGDCQFLLERMINWLRNGTEFQLSHDMSMMAGVMQAIMAHLYLAWIHPFGDGNGRTARLVEYRILLKCGVPSPAVHLLSNHYNLTRAEYYRQLDGASASGGNYLPFFEYALRGFVDGLREQITHIRKFQLEVIWRNYVHELFGERKSDVDRRRRDLVLALGDKKEAVRVGQISALNTRMALHYGHASRMVLNRDLNELKRMGLIERSVAGSRARTEVVEAFLPFRLPGRGPSPQAAEPQADRSDGDSAGVADSDQRELVTTESPAPGSPIFE
jgi:Fic family protein